MNADPWWYGSVTLTYVKEADVSKSCKMVACTTYVDVDRQNIGIDAHLWQQELITIDDEGDDEEIFPSVGEPSFK
jgi:hypothetical protein